MRTKLNLQTKDNNLYMPEPAKIIKIESHNDKEKLFQLELLERKTLGNIPGQFVQVLILGYGEAPISITSAPRDDNKFELSLRAVGDVTNKLCALKEGDIIQIRGPFGHGFDDSIIVRMRGKHLLIVAGGTGLFPVRSLINKLLPERNKYKKISLLYGCKSPQDRAGAYEGELKVMAKMGENVELLETVDKVSPEWAGNVGVITTLIPKVDFVPEETIAVIYGPPIMYKFVLKALKDRKISNENIYMSLERRMRCGIGKCGHCQMEGIYVCQEGPVFQYAGIETNEEVF